MSNAHPYQAQRCLFKAYDIRGERILFTDAFITSLAHAFVHFYALSAFIKADEQQPNQTGKKTPSPIIAINQLPSPPRNQNLTKLTVVIGHDVRHHSKTIAQRLATIFEQHHIKVVWLGLITTPMMAYWAQQYDGHGFIATASHSERHINGIKWLIAGESPSGEDIQSLYQCLKKTTLKIPTGIDDKHDANSLHQNDGNNNGNNHNNTSKHNDFTPNNKPTYTLPDVATSYYMAVVDALTHIHYPTKQISLPKASEQNSKQNLASKTAEQNTKKLTIVIDCLNGATSEFAHDFFAQFTTLCSKVIVINDLPDGNFPKGNPDPTEADRLTELQQYVVAHHADIGFGFDGDGDRLMVVDNLGKVITPDHLLYLLARIAIAGRGYSQDKNLNDEPSSAHIDSALIVIFDVKCSHHLPQLIRQIGAVPQMSKTGSSIMRRALQTGGTHAIFAGELSGHFLFNDGYFILHDDAMYAALRLLHWLAHQDDSLANIIKNLPNVVNTSDIYIPLAKFDKLSGSKHPTVARLDKLCGQLKAYLQNNLQCNIQNKPQNQDNKAQQNNTDDYCEDSDTASYLTAIKDLNLPKNTHLTCIDGIRLDFDNGFGVIRPSNTSPCLTIRFSGNTFADLQQIQARFVQLIQIIEPDISTQIAKIVVNR